MNQAYAQPQLVVMPVPQSNGLGVFAFFVALIGLFIPTGIVAVLGLVLSLVAIGRAPRGFATMGVILGLLGTIFWLVVMVAAVAAGLLGLVVVALAVSIGFMMTQPEVVELTSDMANVAIAVEEYQQRENQMPGEINALQLGVASTIDPWGVSYKLVSIDEEPGFDVISGGPDGEFETGDDVRLSRLDRVWEHAFASFEEKMEAFGQRLEAIDGCRYSCGDADHIMIKGWGHGAVYEHAARVEIEHDRASCPGPLGIGVDVEALTSGGEEPSEE